MFKTLDLQKYFIIKATQRKIYNFVNFTTFNISLLNINIIRLINEKRFTGI